MTQWIIGGLLAVALALVGFVTYDAIYDDDYKDQPGVVYVDEHPSHDHGYFGVE